MGFIDLERAYDRKALCQVLRMYDMRGKLLNGIKSMYVYSSSCVRVEWREIKRFRIDSGVSQGCIMSPLLFNVYMDGVMKEVKMRIGSRGMR